MSESRTRIITGVILLAAALWGLTFAVENWLPDAGPFRNMWHAGAVVIPPIVVYGAVTARSSARRRRADEAIRASEERYHSLFDHMPHGLAYCKSLTDEDAVPVDFEYLAVNSAFEKLTGIPSHDIIGKRITEVIPDIIRSDTDLIGICGRVALTGDETEFVHFFEPLEKWLSVSVYCPRRGYFVTAIEDITDRKWTEEKLKVYQRGLEEIVEHRTAELHNINQQLRQEVSERTRAQQELRNLYETEEDLHRQLQRQVAQRTEFSRVLVHELKTPLTPILGASDMLVRNLTEEPWLNLATNINRGAHNLNKRIDELLDLARGEMGMLKLKCQQVDVGTLLRRLADYVRPEAERLGQTLRTSIPASLSSVWADPDRLWQVILNLLDNALKYNRDGGQITLMAGQRRTELVIAVQDTGLGLSETEQERLFEPYHRLERDRERFSGLGLGLALAKVLLELHGGSIWIRSVKGKGSTFVCSMPLNPPDKAQAEHTEEKYESLAYRR